MNPSSIVQSAIPSASARASRPGGIRDASYAKTYSDFVAQVKSAEDKISNGKPLRLTEAAANLYAHLRALDATGADTIAVAPIPGAGLAEAIRDRLARAAAPR